MAEKSCSTCSEVKPLQAFHPRNDRGRYESRCKSCCAKRAAHHHREWQKRNKARYASGETAKVSEKKCWRCKASKPAREFGVSRSAHDGLNPSCKACAKAYATSVGNPRRSFRDPHGRIGQIWTKYRLRPDQYQRMLEQQGNCCAVCLDPLVRTPHVDHCHKTGVVRGLLCVRCNALMAALDRDGYVEAAQRYLATVSVRCGWIQRTGSGG